MRGISLHGLDQVWDQVRPTLILIQHLAPCRLGVFFRGRDGVVAATGKHGQEKRQDKESGQGADGSKRRLAQGEHGHPHEFLATSISTNNG